MPSLRLVDGLPLIVDSKVAVSADCCCGSGACCGVTCSPCRICWYYYDGEQFEYDYQESGAACDSCPECPSASGLFDGATGLEEGELYRIGVCCGQGGCYYHYGDTPGIAEGPTCVSGTCVSGVTAGQCSTLGGTFTEGATCASALCACTGDADCPDGSYCDGGCRPCAACPSGQYYCIEYTFEGNDCSSSQTSGTFFAGLGPFTISPCTTPDPYRVGVRSTPCGGFNGNSDLVGTVTYTLAYDESGNCTATITGWADLVVEWNNLPNPPDPECDCQIAFVAVTVKNNSICP